MEQGYDYKESEKQHQKEQKPILDERFAYINKRQLEYASKLKMGKVITYAMRYVGRPAMAESRIIKYSKTEDTIEWFYHDHKDEVKHIVKEDSKSFKKNSLFISLMRIFALFVTMDSIQTKQEKNWITFMNC